MGIFKSRPKKINTTATAAPTANDDITQGYSIGSTWYNTATGKVWWLQDVTAGAANWVPLTGESYKGVWDASTNTPTIADGSGVNGDNYYTGTAGTQDLGSGSIVFTVGDRVIYNGSIWEKLDGGVPYVPEDEANKATDFTTVNDTLYPSVEAVKEQLDLKADLASPTFTGTVTSSGKTIAGDPGTEGSGIDIGGVTYESTFKVSDIDGTNFAQNILHRHSTTLEPLIVGARSNSNTSAHADVTAGQAVFGIYAAGYAGSNYKLFGTVKIGADDTGTISNTSAPGKMTFSVTPDGSTTPAVYMTVNNDKKVTFEGNINGQLLTASELVATDANKNLVSLPIATYPSLTELSYVKGVTSAIQTQLDSKVDENAAITGATKTKVTYDAKGLVTAGADATTADIAASTDKNYVTDAEAVVIGNTSGTNTGDQNAAGVANTPAGNIAATDVQAAINELDSEKEPTISAGTTAQYYRGDKTFQTLDKSAVGLANVDNTSDANKPVSTAQQTALDLKADLASPALTGTPTAPTAATTTNTTQIATTAFVQTEVTAATVGLLDDRGNYDASVNTFPASGGSGAAGAILKGDLWTISVAGTLGGNAVTAGDVVRALVDTPAQIASNWAISENNIGYVAENQANKENSTIDTSTTKYPTVNLLKTGLDLKADLASPAFTGTPTSPAFEATDGTNQTLVNGSGAIEIANTSGNALIDFKTGTGEDYDCRIIQNSDGLQFHSGGDGSASNALTIDSSQVLTPVNPIAGSITGNAATVTTNANLTGDVTSVGNAATIANDAVTYAKMQNISATDKILGRSTAGAGDAEEITCTAAGRALLDDASASAQRTTLGVAIGSDVQAYDLVLDEIASQTIIAEATSTRTLALTDANDMIRTTGSSTTTITVPTNASVAFPVGTQIDVLQAGTGQVVFAAAGGVTLQYADGLKISAQHKAASLKKITSDTWALFGALAA